jgi:peptidoglycan/xylan/chitin deacetylase (PgdA/CDA1 family)
MRRILPWVSLLALLSLGCGSDESSPDVNAAPLTGNGTGSAGSDGAAGAGAAGAAANTGGSAGAAAIEEAPLPTSGIPLLAAQDVAKPAGTPGNLMVLDWAGFKAAVSYTFDDTNRSQIKHYPELQALGVHYSFYLITSRAESLDPIWKQAVMDGHEVANHTQSHIQTGDVATLGADTDAGDTFLKNNVGVTVYTMAAPYGTATYADVARTRYLINRGVGDGLITPNGANDPFNLNCWIPNANTPATGAGGFNAKIDAAYAAGAWQTILVHGFTDMDAAEGAYNPVDFNEFVAGVNYSKSLGDLWIDSLVNVGAYWLGAKAFNATPPTTSGDTTTWTWTLPDHFPPNKYLRVTVDGGTLVQNDKALPWDPHGYYEVALDAKSLQLMP